jgi:hypothetical protein
MSASDYRCATYGCGATAESVRQVQTLTMSAPAFYGECEEHQHPLDEHSTWLWPPRLFDTAYDPIDNESTLRVHAVGPRLSASRARHTRRHTNMTTNPKTIGTKRLIKAVMEYEAGCDEGKRAFLHSLGIESERHTTAAYRVTIERLDRTYTNDVLGSVAPAAAELCGAVTNAFAGNLEEDQHVELVLDGGRDEARTYKIHETRGVLS